MWQGCSLKSTTCVIEAKSRTRIFFLSFIVVVGQLEFS